uniref:A disintegrin and metalloproteinase with thrombospondin motifs 13 n=1 Tax=Magallana gigas TaxID=29159 RepID=K1PWN7_MAGGI
MPPIVNPTPDAAMNGGWSAWGQFTPCGKSCGGGIQVRFRSCDHPSPSNGGLPCYGNSLQTASCNNKICPQLVTLTNPVSIETTTRLPSEEIPGQADPLKIVKTSFSQERK